MSVLAEYYKDNYTYTESSTVSSTSPDTTSTTTGKGLLRQDDSLAKQFTIGNDAQAYKFYIDEQISVKRGNIITINSKDYTIAGRKVVEDLEDDTESHILLILYR